VASVWAGIFLQPLILFSAHPLLNSAGILFITQGIIVLQPTHTPNQKKTGTLAHFATVELGIALLIAGLIVIEVNKLSHPVHFQSVHAILGLVTYVVLALQALLGSTAYFAPQLYGGVSNAKALYKWHRMSGYVVLTLLLATVAAATQTDFNKGVIHIKLAAILVSAILVLVGFVFLMFLSPLALNCYKSHEASYWHKAR
jgi:hypothetical protein